MHAKESTGVCTSTPRSLAAGWRTGRLAGTPPVPVWTIRLWAPAPEVVVTAASSLAGTPGASAASLAARSWVQAHSGVLSPAERARAARFATSDLARRWSASRALLRVVLADRLDADPRELQFERRDSGKPMLGGRHKRTVSFSLAHTEEWVVVATSSDCSLGVDAEAQVTRKVAAELIGVFTPAEQHQLTGLHSRALPAAITQLWTRKEAYLKALGTGLLRDPSLDTIGVGHQPRIPAGAPAGTAIIDLPPLPGSTIHAALCVIDRCADHDG